MLVDFGLFAVILLTQHEIVRNLNLPTLFVIKSNIIHLMNFFFLIKTHKSEENPLQLSCSSPFSAASANALLNSYTC